MRNSTPYGAPSRRARATAAVAGAIPDAFIRRLLTNPPRIPGGAATPALKRRYDVDETVIGPGTVVTASPRARANGRHLFFLHGGAYTLQGSHWKFLMLFLDRGWTVSYVDYPLAPEHTVDDTVPMVIDAWQKVTALASGPVDLAGDSAGGGLALVLLQRLGDLGLPMPHRSVLLSPWVDLVLDDPETIAEARRDPVLSLLGLRGAARLYAGDRDLADPWLSPLNGDLRGLGQVQAWVGTREMFLPQCRLLADRCATAPGTDLTLHLGHGLIHDWALFPMPERELLVDEMLAFLG